MRLLTSYIFRALCALLIGFLLVSNPTAMTSLLVQVIGLLFAFSGLFAFVGYFVSNYRARQTRERLAQLGGEHTELFIPSPSQLTLVVGVGSVALGAVLVLWPQLFINVLMYVLGILLLLTGGYQLQTLVTFRRVAPLSLSLFVMPVLIIVAGLMVVLYPMQTASLPFTILGIAYIGYGVTEFFYGLRLQRFQNRFDRQLGQFQDIEEAQYEEIRTSDDGLPAHV